METGDYGTTPFGRRPMTLALVNAQRRAGNGRAGKARSSQQGRAVDKWALYRDLCVAKDLIGAGDRALAVLSALLSFYPDDELCDDTGLIVFPSNRQLRLRAHGMADTTLRRHLAALVDCGLIGRRDSPNGKRYAHKDRAGEVEEAFGLSLAPLLARADEIAQAAEEVRTEARLLKRTRERITLQRRDIAKLIEAAQEEGITGDWAGLRRRFRAVVDAIPRRAATLELTPILVQLDAVRLEVDNCLNSFNNVQISDGNVSQTGRQHTDSNPDSHFDLEPAFEKDRAKTAEPNQPDQARQLDDIVGEAETTLEDPQPSAVLTFGPGAAERPKRGRAGAMGAAAPLPSADHAPPSASKTYPLPLVLKACPDIIDYAAAGQIASWRELAATAAQVRAYLGISPSAYDDACETMGPETAAVTIACILQRIAEIQSPGGYLRSLTEKARCGQFSIGPMIMANLKAGSGARLGAAKWQS